MMPTTSRFYLLLLLVSPILMAEDGRYPTPEQSPAFSKLKFISKPVDRAYPGVEYNIRPAVIGGTWPYRFALATFPQGMSIDKRKGTISWKAPKAEGRASVTIAVKDRKGRTASQSFTITVSRKGFVFVSPNGDDANSGTFEKPWKTVMRAAQPVEDPANTTLYLRGGTYRIDKAASPGRKDANVLAIRRTSPRRWVAWPGEKPVIDLGWSRSKWEAALDAERAKVKQTKKGVVTTQGYGHRISLDHQIDGLLFDGLEVKNASYYMFVMWDGNRTNLTWRRCNLHHLYGDYAENSSFIFGFAPDRKYEKPAEGERFAFGKRPKAKTYKHIVVQDSVVSDRPYWSLRGWHGGGLVWYATQECLVEDCRFERIERGKAILDKDNGWDNTYRNNIILGDVMMSAQGCNDGLNIHHNFINGHVSIGSQPGWVRNIWLHHNSIRGGVCMMAGATQGPVGEIELPTERLNGPTDPSSHALVKRHPLDRRLIFAWANAIDIPDTRKHNMISRISTKGNAFAKRFSYVWWGGNLMDGEANYVLGWAGHKMSWKEFITSCGFEKEGDTGKIVFDEEGHLPAKSPWRTRYGRDAATKLRKKRRR